MDACHILLGLGRPWQYDNHVIHKGRDNMHGFFWMGKKAVLLPLSKTEGKKKVSTKSNTKRQLFLLSQGKDLLHTLPNTFLAFVIKGDSFDTSRENLDSHISKLLNDFPTIIESPTSLPLLNPNKIRR